jgi:hypothetical protein
MPVKNLVAMSVSGTPGTGTITLGSALPGWNAFTASDDGKTFSLSIIEGDDKEVSTGTYTHSGTTLTRTLVDSTTGSLLSLTSAAEVRATIAAGDIENPLLVAPTETVYSLTGTDIDPANGTVQQKTLSANTTFTESLSDGQSITLMIDDGSAYTITWPTITWVNNGGSAPTLATTGYTVIVIWKAGGTLYGALAGNGT